jgi:beta-galactosidase
MFEETASLFEDLGTPIASKHPQPLEVYGQNQGCVLYKTKLPAGEAGILNFTSINDYAQIFVDGQKVAIHDRRTKKGKWVTGFNEKGQNIIKRIEKNRYEVAIPLSERENEAELVVFVEAMGHINYGAIIDKDRKGILGEVIIDSAGGQKALTDWQAYLLPLNKQHLEGIGFKKEKSELPAFYRARFTLKETGDTFLDMRTWGKGVVWINGHNIGRFWRIGPSQTLYVPAPWLKMGENEIIVLELQQIEKTTVVGLSTPILDQSAG